MTDAKKGQPGAKITPPGELPPEPSLTVDRDSWMEKDISGASNPDTVWTLADGTQVRPAELGDPFAGTPDPKPGA